MNLNLRRLEKRFDLEAYLEEFEPRDSGANWILTCPQCEKEEKLYVLMDDKVTRKGTMPRGSYICYYCADSEGGGTGRGILQLISYLEDVDFIDAAKVLAKYSSGKDGDFADAVQEAFTMLYNESDRTVTAEDDIPEVKLPRRFVPIDHDHVPPYLLERDISVKRAMRYGLGYARQGKYRNRLIVPVYFNDYCAGFQARWMAKDPPKGVKKTLFPKQAKMGNVLFNYDEVKMCRRVVLVEDPWSAIHIGRTATTGFGTKLSAAQLDLLMRTEAHEIVVMWDEDAYEKSLRFAGTLAPFWQVRCVRLPDARDPDEHDTEYLRELIAETPLLTPTDAFAASVRELLSFL